MILETAALMALAMIAAAQIAAAFSPDTSPRAPNAQQGQQRAAGEVQQAFLAQTQEHRLEADTLKNVERLKRVCGLMSQGAPENRYAVSLGRLPSEMQGWVRTVASNPAALGTVAAAPHEALRDHLMGRAQIPGLPSLADGAEAALRGCDVANLAAARKVQAWQSTGRTLDPAPSALERRRRARQRGKRA